MVDDILNMLFSFLQKPEALNENWSQKKFNHTMKKRTVTQKDNQNTQ